MEISVDLLLRWLHILTAIILVGGAAGGAFLGQANIAPLARGAVIGGIVTLLGSGLITMMRVISTVPKGWHMLFGIKFLLALHVFAMLFLMTKPDATVEKRTRWRKSALASAIIIVLIAGYMRAMRGA